MPIYEYRCGACGAEREMIVRPGAQPRPSCPSCRRRMSRVISPTAFILKGEGWYVTDYPSQERKRALEAEKGTGKEKPAAAAPPAKEAAPKKETGSAPKEGAPKRPRGRKGS